MRTRKIIWRLFLFGWWGAVCLGGGGSGAWAAAVHLPLTVDDPMLRSLVAGSAFTGPGRTAVLMDEDAGCRRVVVSDPSLQSAGGTVRFETKVSVRMGVTLAGDCRLPVEWEGFVVLIQKPRIGRDWRLSFETQDSFVLDRDRRPAALAGIVWEFVQSDVIRYLEAVTVDLGPPVTEMKRFLTEVAPAGSNPVANLLESLRPAAAAAEKGRLRIDVLGDLHLPPAEPVPPSEAALSEEEVRVVIRGWERWDAYIAFLITALAGQPLSEEDRLLLLETLLRLRYEFVEAERSVALHDDFVRRQFVSAWQRLAPLFRRHLGDEGPDAVLGYLALFSASDALVVLDRVGPALGIEIRSRGLLRLARLLDPDRPASLDYGPEVDDRLRQVIGLEDRFRERPPLRMPKPPPPLDPAAGWLFQWLCPPWAGAAWAAKPPETEMQRWIPSGSDLDAYTKRVRGLVEEASGKTLQKKALPAGRHDLFRRTALATAWQESCFRQFVEKDGNISYIVSYNGSSVGLMQINVRVWRGIYQEEDLRWSIRYNAAAGCEILDIYLQRYAMRKLKEQKLLEKVSSETLSRLVYALYNGGPGQFEKFLARSRNDDFQLSDRLYYEKLQWVRQGLWGKLQICLVGE